MPGQFLKAFLSAWLWVKELEPTLHRLGIRTDIEVEGPRRNTEKNERGTCSN